MTRGASPVDPDVATLLDACQLLAEQEEGPYRRDAEPRRRDVTEGRPGTPLRLGLRLRTARGDPAQGADVEIWHCDAEGRYSGYPPSEPGVAIDPSPQPASYLPDETFLRGAQTTDAAGDVEFWTIHPGWYPGRAVHIHLTVHTETRSSTTQLYFPEDISTAVFANGPYRDHGLPDTTHRTDGIFSTGGRPVVLDMQRDGDGFLGLTCLVLPEETS